MNEGVKIEGDLDWTFDRLEKDFPRYAKAALYRGASILKEETREQMTLKIPNASRPNSRYSDTLLDAVRNSKSDGNIVKVHVMGTREPSSGTFRARFFEGGTHDRFQKTQNGKALKKKRFIGHIEPKNFFGDAVSSAEGRVIEAMEEVINRLFENDG